MKKLDYFLSSLVITLALFLGLCAFLTAEYNSAKYIPTATPRLLEITVQENGGEITVFGKQKKWDLTHLENELSYLKRFSPVISRPVRLTVNTVSLIFQTLCNTFSSVTVGDETPSPPR